jgi:hypothetical protein
MITDIEICRKQLVHLFTELEVATTSLNSIWILASTLIPVAGVTTGVSVIAWLE